MSLLLLLKEGEVGEGTLEAITGDAAPSSVSATLNGIVKPNGLAAKYWFELSEGTGPPEPPTPGILPDEVTESSLFPTGETDVSFEHASGAEATTAAVYISHSDADEVGASAVEYGGVPMTLEASDVRGASPWPGAQVWVADGVPAGPQIVEITKHTDVRLRAIAQTFIADGAVVVGDADAGSGNNTEPAVPALTATDSGLALGIVAGTWADLPTERAEDLLIQRDEGAQVYDVQTGYVGAGEHILDWAFGAAANNARAGIVLLDPDPPGLPKEFAASAETGDLSEFDHVQSIPERATVDEETATHGTHSWRLEVQEGDEEPDTGNERSEPVSGLLYTEGDKPYFGFDFLIESHDPAHWALIHQVHDDGGDEPPVAVYLYQDEDENPIIVLQHGTGTPRYWEAPRPPLGQWNRLVYAPLISDSEGFVGPVWLNGEQMTMLNGEEVIGPFNTSGIQPAYDKGGPGIYRSIDSVGTTVIRGDNYRIYRTFFASDLETTEGVEGEVEVSALLEGLKPNTAYHFRLFAMSEEGLVVGEDIAFTTVKPSRIAVNREFPPAKHCVIVRDPKTGAPITRWAEDEAKAHNVMNGLRLSGTMPGGKKELRCALPRNPRQDWPDTEGFLEIEAQLPGRNRIWHGRIGKAPRSDGDRMVIEGEAVGYAASLEDRKALRIGFIDPDFSKWGEPSVARRAQLIASAIKLMASTSVGAASQEPGGIGAAIVNDFNNVETVKDETEAGEAHYSSDGIDIGEVLYDYLGDIAGGGANADYESNVALGATDVFPSPIVGADHDTTEALQQSVAATGAGYRFARIRNRLNTASEGVALKRIFGWQPKVISRLAAENLTLQGTWPNVGYTVAQMLRLAVPEFSELRATEESVEDDALVIPDAWFSDPGTLARFVDELVKYGLYDWFVKDAKLFELREPGTYGGRWQASLGPSNFQEAGTDTERAWDRIVGAYRDSDGTIRYVGWPGSGADTESEQLLITDPDHPAVRAGVVREDILDLQVQSTAERAIEVCERWLSEANELSRSGEARLTGYVQDECGVFYPAAVVAEGDLLRFRDARDKSYRKIVNYDYAADDLAVDVDLDAPDEDVKALLERYRAALYPLGIR